MGHTIPHCMTYMTTRSNTGFACLVRENVRSRHKPLTGKSMAKRETYHVGVLVTWRDYYRQGEDNVAIRAGPILYPCPLFSLDLPSIQYSICRPTSGAI